MVPRFLSRIVNFLPFDPRAVAIVSSGCASSAGGGSSAVYPKKSMIALSEKPSVWRRQGRQSH